MVKIEIVKSEENDADLFTMNLPSNLLERHARKLVSKWKEVDVEVQQEGVSKDGENARALSLT